MKLSIPVGCIVSVSEELSWKLALTKPLRAIEILSAKLIRSKWDTICLTDIDDDGTIYIIHLSNKGYEKIKYEDWQEGKFVEIHELQFTHSKEELYRLLEQEVPTFSRIKRIGISLRDLVYNTSLLVAAYFSSYTLILNRSKRKAEKRPTPAQYAAYIWNDVTGKLPYWPEYIPESLNTFVNDEGKLLYRGEAKDLAPTL
jgi:hypothetical protein